MTDHIQFSPDQDALVLLDQRILPGREEYFVCKNTKDTIYALQTMVVRGAPAIGVTAAYGCYLASREVQLSDAQWKARLEKLLKELEEARPTAVNLRWAVALMRSAWQGELGLSLDGLQSMWLAMAQGDSRRGHRHQQGHGPLRRGTHRRRRHGA